MDDIPDSDTILQIRRCRFDTADENPVGMLQSADVVLIPEIPGQIVAKQPTNACN